MRISSLSFLPILYFSSFIFYLSDSCLFPLSVFPVPRLSSCSLSVHPSCPFSFILPIEFISSLPFFLPFPFLPSLTLNCSLSLHSLFSLSSSYQSPFQSFSFLPYSLPFPFLPSLPFNGFLLSFSLPCFCILSLLFNCSPSSYSAPLSFSSFLSPCKPGRGSSGGREKDTRDFQLVALNNVGLGLKMCRYYGVFFSVILFLLERGIVRLSPAG